MTSFTKHDHERLERVEHLVQKIAKHVFRGKTVVFSATGAIDMAQSVFNSRPGTEVLTIKTVDANQVDITTRCSYVVASDGPAMAFSPVTGNLVTVTKIPGTANVALRTTDLGGDVIPDVNLFCTIVSPAATTGETTISSTNPDTHIG